MTVVESELECAILGSHSNEILRNSLIEMHEGLSLRHRCHVIQNEPEAELLQPRRIVFDCCRIQHGSVFHADTLPYDSLAESLQVQLTVSIGQIQQT